MSDDNKYDINICDCSKFYANEYNRLIKLYYLSSTSAAIKKAISACVNKCSPEQPSKPSLKKKKRKGKRRCPKGFFYDSEDGTCTE